MPMEIYHQLLEYYGYSRPDRRGEIYVECPFCGKAPKPGQVHFSFSRRGFKCFCCGEGGSLYRLARHLRLIGDQTPLPPPASRERPVPPPPDWLAHAEGLVRAQTAHRKRYQWWRAYKPLRPETVDRWRLGVGSVPGWRGEWLTFPVFDRGQIVGLRGRALGKAQSPKWVNATGSGAALFNRDGLGRQRVLWIVENMADAALVMQEHPDYDAVAPTTGVATWRSEWTALVAGHAYELVIVAFDNDLAGQAEGLMRDELLKAWREKFRKEGKTPPPPNGPKVANALLAAGVKAVLFHWGGAPARADVGWLIGQQMAAV